MRKKNSLNFLLLHSSDVDALDLVVDLHQLIVKSEIQKMDNVLDQDGGVSLDLLLLHALDQFLEESLDLAGLLLDIGPVLLHLDDGLLRFRGLVEEFVAIASAELGVDHVEAVDGVSLAGGELDGGLGGSGRDQDDGDVGVRHHGAGKVGAGRHLVDGLGDGGVDEVLGVVAFAGDVVAGVRGRFQNVHLQNEQ